ncbi:MAG: hypothetical protein EA426_00790 [Spirochaetaceae bacterium]|nr:MAG: hypothetical protein EA426_00790 [Spirochaetaceae bacterium]
MLRDILKVKTRIPPIARTTLERTDIHDRLEAELFANDELLRPLTLVSAPAGYGKTTVVRTWHRGREKRTGWYSIDAEDDAPERFWAYVVVALQSVEPDVGQTALEMAQTALAGAGVKESSYLTPLLNDLYALDEPVFLVLDDYHLIGDHDIHESMTFLLENAPPTLHVTVTTRSDPPWPLAVWRARGHLAEVRAFDLRFSEEDAASFFGRFDHISLSPALMARLCDRTEGWATGLQLAALSLSTASDPEGFIRGFTGSNRHVLHYLADEVFEKQSAETREFLVSTSLLDRFCAELCDAVTGRSDAAETLRTLDRDNLFVIALDDDGRWYRYHHLFSDLLRSRLAHDAPDRVAQVHERAAHWFLSVGDPGEAIRHALATDHTDDVIAILTEYSYDVLRANGSLRLFEALSVLNLPTLERNPSLLVHYALLSLVYARTGSDDAIAAADRAVHDMPEDFEIIGMLETVKAFHKISAGRLSEAVAHADKAVKLLPHGNSYWRMNVAIYSGDARLFAGNPREAFRFYSEADLTSKVIDHTITSLTTSFKVATSLQYMGRNAEAEKICRQALKAARERGQAMIPRAGLHWGLLGRLLHERGELDEADECIERGLAMSESERTAYSWNCLHALGLAISRRDYDRGLDLAGRIESLNRESPLPLFVTIPAYALAALVQIGLGVPEAALARLAQLDPRLPGAPETETGGSTPYGRNPETIPPGLEYAVLSAVRARLAMRAADGSDRDILQELERRAESGAHVTMAIETRLVLAALAISADEPEEAEMLVRSALEKGAECGLSQVFVDELPWLSEIYRRVSQSKGTSEPTRRLATRICPGAAPAEAGGDLQTEPSEPQHSPISDLVEPLSPREIEILACIGRGLSNEETGEELFISAGTVKWHMGNIFGKLGVGNRTRAAAAAREMGLIR